MQREHPVQVAQLEDPLEPGFRAHQDQVAIVAPDPTQGADHGSQAGGVDEVDGGKVEHEPGVAGGDQLRHLLAEPGGSGHVEVASEHQNGPRVPRDVMELEVHVDPSASVAARWSTPTLPNGYSRPRPHPASF